MTGFRTKQQILGAIEHHLLLRNIALADELCSDYQGQGGEGSTEAGDFSGAVNGQCTEMCCQGESCAEGFRLAIITSE
jgi:hypothetical protein